MVAPAEQKVFQMAFLVSKHDEKVDMFFLHGRQYLFRRVSFLEHDIDGDSSCLFLFDNLIKLLSGCREEILIVFSQVWQGKVPPLDTERIMDDMDDC